MPGGSSPLPTQRELGLGSAVVGFQGEPGAYSEEAALALFPDADTLGHPSFTHVFDALAGSGLGAAVLPVENSLAGIVQEPNDLLWQRPGLRVRGEYVHPIRHCLMGGEGEVRRALSQPIALAQCRLYLEAQGIELVPFHDTAGSARHVSQSPEPGLAAIASAAAARRYGLRILAENIQNDPSNRTRFLVVDRGLPARPGTAQPGWKASLAFIAAHRPGSLVTALTAFSSRGVNLTRLDSRPLPDRPFEYLFYVDFEIGDAAAAESALLELEGEVASLKLFGTYPAAPPV